MVETITNIILAVVSAISVVYTIYTKFKSTKKTTQEIQKANEVISNLQVASSIVQEIPKFIKEAEDIFGANNGALKLRYVLQKIEILCVKTGLEYHEREYIQQIETILTTPQSKNISISTQEYLKGGTDAETQV